MENTNTPTEKKSYVKRAAHFVKKTAKAALSSILWPIVDTWKEVINFGKKMGKWFKSGLKGIKSDISENFKDAGFLWWKGLPRTFGSLTSRGLRSIRNVIGGILTSWGNNIKKVTERISANVASVFYGDKEPVPVMWLSEEQPSK